MYPASNPPVIGHDFDCRVFNAPTTTERIDAIGGGVLRGVLDPCVCELSSAYLRLKADIGEMCLGDGQLAMSYSSYADLLMEVLLDQMRRPAEELLDVSLLPTHSYTRLYRHRDELTPHTDRPACEVVVSLTLGYAADAVWPLHVRGSGTTFECLLEPGDCVVYAGSQHEHWRTRFDGQWQAQTTLHYVRSDGPFADWAFDKRPALGRHVGTRRT